MGTHDSCVQVYKYGDEKAITTDSSLSQLYWKIIVGMKAKMGMMKR